MSCSVIENYPYKPMSNSVQKYIQVNSTLHRNVAENKNKYILKKEKYIDMLKHIKILRH